jgi:hypothetical protein
MNCPYCQFDGTKVFYRAQMPNLLSACPVGTLRDVLILPFEASYCDRCILGFNSTPLDDQELRTIYDNYLYINPSKGIGYTRYQPMTEIVCRLIAREARVVEIGCSEGYLLSKLSAAGYQNLVGIEPGPQAEAAHAAGFSIIRDYLTVDTQFDGEVDCFLLMHVFEHFQRPWDILEVMRDRLSVTGLILIEVPYFGGYHHQHLYFFSSSFFERLCSDLQLALLESKVEQDVLRVVLGRGKSEIISDYASSDREAIAKIVNTAGTNLSTEATRVTELLMQYQTLKVGWWGAGSTSVILLNQIEHSLLRQSRLTILDGDSSKWGCGLPGVPGIVEDANKYKGLHFDLIIIASSFFSEIVESMSDMGITADKVERLTLL